MLFVCLFYWIMIYALDNFKMTYVGHFHKYRLWLMSTIVLIFAVRTSMQNLFALVMEDIAFDHLHQY